MGETFWTFRTLIKVLEEIDQLLFSSRTTTQTQKPFLLLLQNLKWQKISICKWDFFCHLQIQSKLLYKHLTFALHWLVHKLQVCKLVSIEFAPSNVSGRQFSNLQMDIFCHFNFWHNRKNGFRLSLRTIKLE